MHLYCRNVNDAFDMIVRIFHDPNSQTKHNSRDGEVLRIDEPVTITYSHPTERVLFNPARDANPFFHLYEALWMLAGRNDVAPLTYYCSKMGKYSDDGKTLNGAYGYRWRHAKVRDSQVYKEEERINQLDLIIDHLSSSPESRRAVLTMWNVEDDLLKVSSSKDVCCNLNVMFDLRTETFTTTGGFAGYPPPGKHDTKYLDMTVTNRSNDAVLGMLGTNYVHFTMLQEYMAVRLGVRVGKYHHFTNNLHVYLRDWKPQEWLAASLKHHNWYKIEPRHLEKLAPGDEGYFESMDQQIMRFVEMHKNGEGLNEIDSTSTSEFSWPFIKNVAEPIVAAYHCHRKGASGMSMEWANRIRAEDWRLACTEWLSRRQKV